MKKNPCSRNNWNRKLVLVDQQNMTHTGVTTNVTQSYTRGIGRPTGPTSTCAAISVEQVANMTFAIEASAVSRVVTLLLTNCGHLTPVHSCRTETRPFHMNDVSIK